MMVFHWSLSDSKFLQVSRTLLSSLADLNNAVVWMVSTRPLISKSSSLCTKSFGDCTERANYNWYHRYFHVREFFQFPSKVQVLISLFAFFQFYPVVSRNGKVHYLACSLFLLTITRSGCLAEIRWSVCILKSQRNLCVSFSWTNSGSSLYHLFVW